MIKRNKYLPSRWKYIKHILFGVKCSECGEKLNTKEILNHRQDGITEVFEMWCNDCLISEAFSEKYNAPF